MALKTTASYAESTGSFEVLPADIYDATLVAIAVRDFQKYDAAPGVKESKYIFIYQLPQEDSEPRFVKTGPIAVKIAEKSNLYLKHLKPITGKTEAELGRAFDPSTLLGSPCRVEVEHETGRDGRVYARVARAIAPGKLKAAVEPAKIPAFFISGSIEHALAEGIEVGEESQPFRDTSADGSAELLKDLGITPPAEEAPRQRPPKIT